MRRFALIGHPLSHSFSQAYFTGKFKESGIDAEYLNLDLASVEQAIEAVLTTPKIEGVNVTIPYKTTIIPHLDELDPAAEEVGAVNTLHISEVDGKRHLKGYNTDIIGFEASIRPALATPHRRALVLGTGGAARAAAYVLRTLGLQVTTVSRNPSLGDLTYSGLDLGTVAEHTVIVNCTPVGMFPLVDRCPDLPYGAVGRDHLLFDMVYNPMETLFMQMGLERGATVMNGLAMLHAQAEASWSIWNLGQPQSIVF